MGDSDIEKEVDNILQQMHTSKEENTSLEVTPKPKKPRKSRIITDKQKQSLAEGRKRRQLEVEIKRLEREKRGGEAAKKLAVLRKEKDEKTKKEEKEEKDVINELKRQLEEIRQQVGKSSTQPIINVHTPPLIDKQKSDYSEQFRNQLQRYIKY